jgi:hypothetical protein
MLSMSISRRVLLGSAAITPLFGLVDCATTPSAPTATVQTDLALLANALQALGPLVNTAPGSAAVFAQVASALAAVQQAMAAATSAATSATVATLTSLLTTLGPAIIGLFPGGGTAVTIVQAVISLLPELEALVGIASVAPNRPIYMTPAMAHGLLAVLPPARE